MVTEAYKQLCLSFSLYKLNKSAKQAVVFILTPKEQYVSVHTAFKILFLFKIYFKMNSSLVFLQDVFQSLTQEISLSVLSEIRK